MFLNSQMHSLLLELDRANLKGGGEWMSSKVLRHYPVHVRQQAQTLGYIIGRGSTAAREYKLLPAGRTALANNAKANLDMMPEIERGFVPTEETEIPPLTTLTKTGGYMNGHHLIKVTKPEARAEAEPPAPEKNIDVSDALDQALVAALKRDAMRSQACVRAIDILAEDFPEVNDLVNSLMKIAQRKAQAHD